MGKYIELNSLKIEINEKELFENKIIKDNFSDVKGRFSLFKDNLVKLEQYKPNNAIIVLMIFIIYLINKQMIESNNININKNY